MVARWTPLMALLLLTACEQPAMAPSGEKVVVQIQATSEGFRPAEVHLIQGRPGVLEFERLVESDCLNAVRMPWQKEAVPLPLKQKVQIPVDTAQSGTFNYACWMSMQFGRVIIDPPAR